MCNLIIKMIIAFTLVGYEMIITNSMVHASSEPAETTRKHPELAGTPLNLDKKLK